MCTTPNIEAGVVRMVAKVIHRKVSQGIGRYVVKNRAEVIHKDPVKQAEE